MPNYLYKALNHSGKVEKGIITATTERTARLDIKAKNLTPLSLKVTNKTNQQKLRISLIELTTFYRQIAAYLKSGFSLDKSLAACLSAGTNSKINKVLAYLYEDVLKGDSLSKSMSSFPLIFDKQVTSIVYAGEQAGSLDETFGYLAEYFEAKASSRKKMLAASAYPLFIFVFSIIIIFALLTFVMPRIISQFQGSGMNLPPVTLMVVWLSENVIYLLGSLLLIALVLSIFFKKITDTFIHIPFIGQFLILLDIERFSQAMIIMLKSGMGFDSALNYANSTLKNSFVADKFHTSYQYLTEGKDFLRPIRELKYLPFFIFQLMESGSKSGDFLNSFLRIQDYLEQEIESKKSIFLAILEPLMIVFLGIFVLVIVLAILIPIMQINTSIL